MASYEDLKRLLSEMESVVIGYSGGVDSTLLAKAATDALGKKALCVLMESCLIPKSEVEEAVQIAQMTNMNLIRISVEPLAIENVADNNPERCYYCKKALFNKLKIIAESSGIKYVLDGANVDDDSDYRPGSRATKELGVRSPLKELGMDKAQVRAMSREIKLSTWDKPSYACLASRVPYGTALTDEILTKIDFAESVLRNLGFKQFRVRHHGNLARIELLHTEMEKILIPAMRKQVIKQLKTAGYTYITLDLAGYRTGSMNETLD